MSGLADAIRDCIKRMTVPPLWPGGPGGLGATEHDIARAALEWFEERLAADDVQDAVTAALGGFTSDATAALSAVTAALRGES